MTEQEVKDSEDYQYLLTTKDYPDYWAYDEDITNITADGTSWRLSWSVPNFDKENGTTTDTCEYIIPFLSCFDCFDVRLMFSCL